MLTTVQKAYEKLGQLMEKLEQFSERGFGGKNVSIFTPEMIQAQKDAEKREDKELERITPIARSMMSRLSKVREEMMNQALRRGVGSDAEIKAGDLVALLADAEVTIVDLLASYPTGSAGEPVAEKSAE